MLMAKPMRMALKKYPRYAETLSNMNFGADVTKLSVRTKILKR
jgi:hypothetical protein